MTFINERAVPSLLICVYLPPLQFCRICNRKRNIKLLDVNGATGRFCLRDLRHGTGQLLRRPKAAPSFV